MNITIRLSSLRGTPPMYMGSMVFTDTKLDGADVVWLKWLLSTLTVPLTPDFVTVMVCHWLLHSSDEFEGVYTTSTGPAPLSNINLTYRTEHTVVSYWEVGAHVHNSYWGGGGRCGTDNLPMHVPHKAYSCSITKINNTCIKYNLLNFKVPKVLLGHHKVGRYYKFTNISVV